MTSSYLTPGQSLQPGQSLSSPNGAYSLWMQTDGNVVLYQGQVSNNSGVMVGDARWSTHTGPGQFTPRDLIMQGDGNLVLYDTSGQARWASGTSRQIGAFLEVQSDGNVVVYADGTTTEGPDGALWQTGTGDGSFHSPFPPVTIPQQGPGKVTGGFVPPDIGEDGQVGIPPPDRR
jgi:hypothetical protein